MAGRNVGRHISITTSRIRSISNLATNLQARVKNKRLTSEYDGMARALKLSARNSTLLQD
jgi:hypothetical protein